jgi:hypothetical protein
MTLFFHFCAERAKPARKVSGRGYRILTEFAQAARTGYASERRNALRRKYLVTVILTG